MKYLLASLIAALAANLATAAAATYPELNVAEGTIVSPDGAFSGRDYKIASNFKLELLYTVPAAQGQWVASAWDNKGRLTTSGYNNDAMNRITIPNVGSSETLKVEPITTTQVGAAEGLLFAFGGLYMNVNRSNTMRHGLYKLTDTNGDDKFDKTEVLRNVTANGDHGTHNLRISPDGKSIFMINGNSTLPTVFQSSRVPRISGEDTLTMRIQTGFMNETFGDYTNEGYTLILDKDAKNYELFTMGSRNPVDFAFNKDGELFTYDSDMEWDMGDPWYRPTHVEHLTSGADFGFRNGSRKHPRYFIDYAGPSVADIGSGSPVGASFGTGAKFPARYQDAMYIADWSYGYLYAVFMTPNGSTYQGEPTLFVSGRPFPVTGVTVNPNDGSMIVMMGGNAQSQLFRVTYTGTELTTPTAADTQFKADREARVALEKFHGKQDSAAVNAAWARLGDRDPRIRYAARIALEWQAPASWQARALDETDPRKSIPAIVALARVSGKDIYSTKPETPAPDKNLQGRMIRALDRIDIASLPYTDQLDLLRAYGLAFIRLGSPDDATRQRLISKIDPLLPSPYRELNWELADMLTYLDAPSAPTKLLAMIKNAPSAPPHDGWKEWINPILRQRQDQGGLNGSGNVGMSNVALAKQEDIVQYAQLLRMVHNGWTLPLREEYLKTFITLGGFRGGNEYASSNAIIRADALSQIPAADKAALADVIALPIPVPAGGRGGGGFGGGGGGGGAGGGGGGAVPAPAGRGQ